MEPVLRSNHRIALLVPALALIAGFSAALATSVKPLTLSEMVKRSPRIVHGTVVEAHSQWDDGGTLIYTYVTLAPKEMLKGKASAEGTVTFRQLGGQVGDKASYVAGTPRFAAKQEVVVFLTGQDRGGYPQVMGIFQGAFRPAGAGRWRGVEGVSPEAIGSLVPDAGTMSPGAAAPPTAGTFDQFLQRIRGLVRDQSEGRAP